MTAAEAIAALPDDTRVSVTVGSGDMTKAELAEALAYSGPVYITTKEASRRYSRSPRWWCKAAKDIPGAYKDRRWRLPVQGIETHLARLTRPKPSRRGPWKEAETAHSVDHRPTHLEAR